MARPMSAIRGGDALIFGHQFFLGLGHKGCVVHLAVENHLYQQELISSERMAALGTMVFLREFWAVRERKNRSI